MSRSIEVFPDGEALVGAATSRLVEAIRSTVAARRRIQIVLTGGGNGIELLRRLRNHKSEVDWTNVHFFWGDERYVPEDSDERNEKQAREALIDHVDVPASQVHPMPASDGEFGSDLVAAALAYEQLLAANAEPGEPTPNFDIHLLGVGPEGHINSVFPDTPAIRETTHMVVSVEDCPKPPPQRITLTQPAVQRSLEVWVLVSGAEKADAVAAAIGGADPVSVPAAGAIGREKTLWLLDEEAAAKLPG